MRTTVTLDPDVERLLKTVAHQRGKSFKVVLNEAVRQSLGRQKKSSKHVLPPPIDMGLRTDLDAKRMKQVLDDLDVEAHLEVTRRLTKKREAVRNDHS